MRAERIQGLSPANCVTRIPEIQQQQIEPSLNDHLALNITFAIRSVL